MTKNIKKSESNEFVVHVTNEYDYRYLSDYREEIFEALKYVFWRHNNSTVPVYGVPDNLKEYHTSKKDISNGSEINPDEKFRLKKEDIYKNEPV